MTLCIHDKGSTKPRRIGSSRKCSTKTSSTTSTKERWVKTTAFPPASTSFWLKLLRKFLGNSLESFLEDPVAAVTRACLLYLQCWEYAIKLCKTLAEQYEYGTFDFIQLSQILVSPCYLHCIGNLTMAPSNNSFPDSSKLDWTDCALSWKFPESLFPNMKRLLRRNAYIAMMKTRWKVLVLLPSNLCSCWIRNRNVANFTNPALAWSDFEQYGH